MNDIGSIIFIVLLPIWGILYYFNDKLNNKIIKIWTIRMGIFKKYDFKSYTIKQLGEFSDDEFNVLIEESEVIFQKNEIERIKRHEEYDRQYKENMRRIEIIEDAIKNKKRISFLYPNSDWIESWKVFLPLTKNKNKNTIRGYFFIVNIVEGQNKGFIYKIKEIVILEIWKIKNIKMFDE